MGYISSIWLGKVIKAVIQLFGSGGSALPGLILNKLNPGLLEQMAAKLKHGSIVVTGTNGKTTTASLLALVLERNGYEVMTNKTGSNLTRGLVSEFLDVIDWRGKMLADIAVLEIDEADLINLLKKLHVKGLIVTNMFRDQLDRYGELDTMRNLIVAAVKELAAGAKLVLNADDPLVNNLGKMASAGVEQIFFGLSSVLSFPPDNSAIDIEKCVECGGLLKYSNKFLAHLGDYKCQSCNFVKSKLNYQVNNVKLLGTAGSEILIESGNGGLLELKTNLPGLYNVYNVLATVAMASEMAVENDLIVESVNKFNAVFGRFEKINISSNQQIYLMLSKNPTGFNQLIKTLLEEKEKLDLVFILNDNYADGRDISWIWDVDFEGLQEKINWIALSGTRAEDMAVRMKYAGIDSKLMAVEKDMKILVNDLIGLDGNKPIYVLASYTGMLQFRSQLVKKGLVKDFWKDK